MHAAGTAANEALLLPPPVASPADRRGCGDFRAIYLPAHLTLRKITSPHPSHHRVHRCYPHPRHISARRGGGDANTKTMAHPRHPGVRRGRAVRAGDPGRAAPPRRRRRDAAAAARRGGRGGGAVVFWAAGVTR
jgi:hypothetical protein